MEIIKPQISVSITKTELNSLINEAMAIPDYAAAIKRVLSPLLAESFPQFPEFTNVTIGDTDESGVTQVILKQPAAPKSNSTIKAIEPAVVIDKPEKTAQTDDAVADAPDAVNVSEPEPEAAINSSELFDSEQPNSPTYVDPFGN